jgi:hypothetical protein
MKHSAPKRAFARQSDEGTGGLGEGKAREIIEDDEGSPLPIRSRKRARVAHSEDEDEEAEGQPYDSNVVTLPIPNPKSSPTSNNWPDMIRSTSPLPPLDEEVILDVEDQHPWLGPSVSWANNTETALPWYEEEDAPGVNVLQNVSGDFYCHFSF